MEKRKLRNNNSTAVITRFAALLFVLMLVAAMLMMASGSVEASSQNLDAFAKCLTEKKAVMYGSFLCPHCQEQKELFGESFAHVKYVECMDRGSRRLSAECAFAQIKHVPTWIFADGERREGVAPLKDLSNKTGCKLP